MSSYHREAWKHFYPDGNGKALERTCSTSHQLLNEI